jgi:hypothetical protein
VLKWLTKTWNDEEWIGKDEEHEIIQHSINTSCIHIINAYSNAHINNETYYKKYGDWDFA